MPPTTPHGVPVLVIHLVRATSYLAPTFQNRAHWSFSWEAQWGFLRSFRFAGSGPIRSDKFYAMSVGNICALACHLNSRRLQPQWVESGVCRGRGHLQRAAGRTRGRDLQARFRPHELMLTGGNDRQLDGVSVIRLFDEYARSLTCDAPKSRCRVIHSSLMKLVCQRADRGSFAALTSEAADWRFVAAVL